MLSANLLSNVGQSTRRQEVSYLLHSTHKAPNAAERLQTWKLQYTDTIYIAGNIFANWQQ